MATNTSETEKKKLYEVNIAALLHDFGQFADRVHVLLDFPTRKQYLAKHSNKVYLLPARHAARPRAGLFYCGVLK